MGQVAAMLCLAVVLAGCSSERLEQTTDCATGSGLRGGVVSYRYSREQAAAYKLAAAYCSPKGYRIVSLNMAAAGEACRSMANEEENTAAVRRTYVRFECEQE
jgi:hypothetical protein